MTLKNQLLNLSKKRSTVQRKEPRVTASPVVEDPTLQTWIKEVSTQITDFGKSYARKQELSKAGVISIKDGVIQPPSGEDDEFSSFVPLAVENLYAGAAYSSVTLTWEQADSKYFGQNEVFRSETNDFGTSVKVGTTRAKVYTDYVGNDAKVYYWVRAVSRFGIEGEVAPSVYAETAQSFEFIKDTIIGKIEESWISQEFNNVLSGIKNSIFENALNISEAKVNLTKLINDAKTTFSDAITETERRANEAIDQAKMLLSQSITNEINKTNTLIETKTNELKNADLAQASTTDRLAVQMRGGYDGSDLDQVSSGLLYQQKQTTTTALETLSRQLSLVSASGNSEFDSGVIYFFDDGAENWLDSTGNAPDVLDGWIKVGNKAGAWTITSSAFKNDLIASKYNEIRLRVRRIGEPANDLVVSVQDASGNVQSRVVEQDAYGYDQLDIVTLSIKPQWTVQSINKISISRASESSYSAEDYFMVDWVAIGRPSPAASYSAVSEEVIARVKGDEINNSKIESYYAEAKNNNINTNARIDNETATRVNNESATTQRIVNAETTIGQNTSKIGILQQNVTDLTHSTAQSFEGLESKFDNLRVGGQNLIKGTAKFDTSGNLKPNYVGLGRLWDTSDTLLNGNYIYLIEYQWSGFYFTGFPNNILDQDCILSFWASNQNESSPTNVYGIASHLGFLMTISSSKWQQYSIKLPRGTPVLNNHNQGVIEFINQQGTVFAYSSIQLQYGNQATQWSPHPDDIAGEAIVVSEANLNAFKETYAGAEEARTSQITQMDSKFTDKTNQINTSLNDTDLIARAMTSGKLTCGDPTFRKGFNNMDNYDNNMSGRNKIERVPRESDNPTTSTHQINVTVFAKASPYYGGFYQLIQSRPSAVFVTKYILKLPIGFMLNTNSNWMGEAYTDRIVGSALGTGKYETYFRLTKCGATGNFSSGGHLSIRSVAGEMLTGEQVMTFPLASIECYDLTDYADMTPAVQENFALITDSLNTLTTAESATASRVTQLQANYDVSNPNARMPDLRDDNINGVWAYAICNSPSNLNTNVALKHSDFNAAKFIRKGYSAPSSHYSGDSLIPEEQSLTLFRGYVYVSQAKSLVFDNAVIDDAVAIYMNGNLQYSKFSYGTEPRLLLDVVAGWNKLDVIVWNGAAGGGLVLNPPLTDQVERLCPAKVSDFLEHTGATALSTYITKEDSTASIAGKIEEFNASSGLKNIRNYKLYSAGLDATTGGTGYIKNLANGQVIYGWRSYMLVVFDGAGDIQSTNVYDVYGTADGYNGFNAAVANLPTGTWVAVLTSDEPLGNKQYIRDAIFSLGGTVAGFDSMVTNRGAYLLVGCKGVGQTTGVIELVSNSKQNGVEYGLTLNAGTLIGANTSTALSQYITKSDANSAIAGKFEEFSSTVSNQVKADLTTQKLVTFDLRDPKYGRDTWFPIVFPLGNSSAIRHHIEIYARLYQNPSDAAWIIHGSRTFSCQYTWEVGASGWGANPVDRQINNAEYLSASGHPVIGIYQYHAESYEVAHVRGGGVYNISCFKDVNPFLEVVNSWLPNSGASISPKPYDPSLVVKTDQWQLTTKITETTQVVDGIKGIKSVFIDNNGVASGYATTSELINGQVRSTFGVYANTFFVADPSNPDSKVYPLIVYNGNVVMDGAIIRDGTITNAKIGELSADKITTGNIAAARMSAGIVEAMSGKFDTLSSITAKIGRFETSNSKGTMIIEGTMIQIVQPDGRIRHKMGLF